jgi:hypothetical protein
MRCSIIALPESRGKIGFRQSDFPELHFHTVRDVTGDQLERRPAFAVRDPEEPGGPVRFLEFQNGWRSHASLLTIVKRSYNERELRACALTTHELSTCDRRVGSYQWTMSSFTWIDDELRWKRPIRSRKGVAMYQRIVVPLDGSKLAAAALTQARDAAKTYNAPLFLVRVVDPPIIQRVSVVGDRTAMGMTSTAYE